MPKTSYADVNLDVDAGRLEPKREPVQEKPDRDTPFRILVMGDFSGRSSRGLVRRGPLKPIAVDRDNFDDVLESLSVQLRIPIEGDSGIDIAIQDLDDFHPDRLFERVPVFARLRDLRDQLSDSKTFAATFRELGGASSAAPAARPDPAPKKAPPRQAPSGGSLLEEALNATESRGPAAAPAKSRDPLARYVQALVQPHLVPRPDPKQKEVLSQVDEATSAAMRGLLHHPLFQQLEAAWRGLYFLVRNLETGPKLKVYILDISREEIEADIASADDLRSTALYKTLVEQTVRTPGAHPWAVMMGCFSFGPSIEDLNLLGRLGLLARQANAPFLACASTRLIGCEDSLARNPYPEDWKGQVDKDGWELIRSLPEARYLGLLLPRVLMRLPYGKETSPLERFAFEEMPGKPDHEGYLWGSGAFVAAYLLGQNFAESGWAMEPGEILSVSGLPMHVYKDGGEAKLTPCAELFLTESAMERMHEAGIMVLMSFQNSDQVRLSGFRSVAAPAAGLSGRWG